MTRSIHNYNTRCTCVCVCVYDLVSAVWSCDHVILKKGFFVGVEVLVQGLPVFGVSLEDGVTQGPPAWTLT